MRLTGLILAAFLSLLPALSQAESIGMPIEDHMINLNVGMIGIADDIEDPEHFSIEYRFDSFEGPLDLHLIPALGYSTTRNGASYFYVDIHLDLYLDAQWLLIPSFGFGEFKESDYLVLGRDLEFRTAIEVAYEFDNRMRLGASLFHLSNGGLARFNPGTEAIVLSISIPVD